MEAAARVLAGEGRVLVLGHVVFPAAVVVVRLGPLGQLGQRRVRVVQDDVIQDLDPALAVLDPQQPPPSLAAFAGQVLFGDPKVALQGILCKRRTGELVEQDLEVVVSRPVVAQVLELRDGLEVDGLGVARAILPVLLDPGHDALEGVLVLGPGQLPPGHVQVAVLGARLGLRGAQPGLGPLVPGEPLGPLARRQWRLSRGCILGRRRTRGTQQQGHCQAAKCESWFQGVSRLCHQFTVAPGGLLRAVRGRRVGIIWPPPQARKPAPRRGLQGPSSASRRRPARPSFSLWRESGVASAIAGCRYQA